MKNRFEKNPPLRPVLTEVITDQKQLLESYLINTKAENVKEENKILDLTQKKRQSILDINKAEIKKLQNNNIIVENFKGDYNPLTEDPSINNSGQQVINGVNISEILKNNEILNKEISELAQRYDKCDIENKNLKNENIKLKENLVKQTSSNESEFHKLKEELEKYKIVNSDRIDLLAQIEEKNNELLEMKKKIHFYENEQELNKRNIDLLSNKINEMESISMSYETKCIEMKNRIEELLKEKNELIIQNQNKIEILQAKLFNIDIENNGSDIEKSQNIKKILEMIYENLNEFESLFKMGITNLEKTFSSIKDDAEKTEKKFLEIVEERSLSFMEILEKTKIAINEELLKFKLKFEDDSKNTKINERIDWMKKQINELMNYKVKSTNLEESLKKIDNHNKKLEEMIELYKYNSETLQKVNEEKEEKLIKNEKYIRNLEARLSDVKDYMFRNHIDKIEEMSKWYKF